LRPLVRKHLCLDKVYARPPGVAQAFGDKYTNLKTLYNHAKATRMRSKTGIGGAQPKIPKISIR